MKKNYKAILCILIIAALLSACGNSDSTRPGSTRPDGVCIYEGKEYYAIRLTDGDTVSEYFAFSGTEKRVAYNYVSIDDQKSDNLGVVYYCSVRDGGTVAYRKGGTGLFLYFPEGFSNSGINNGCTLLALGTIEDSMSISEAMEYIPGLKKD